ncbi:type 4a pilus biogenesis protein PilO [Bdellovibrionota bacterium FG-1]
MNNERIKEVLERLPLGFLLILYMGYLGFDYYSFTTASDSPLLQKQSEVANIKKNTVVVQEKLKVAHDFFKSLDAKRGEIRHLAQVLGEMKGSLSADVDVPSFMKMVVTEAKKVGLNVMGIKPIERKSHEYYEEQPFALGFKGVYVQLLVFLERLSNVQNIVRVDDFEIRPISASGARFVELEGVLQIKTFKYLGTKADEIGKAAYKPQTVPSGAQAAPGPAKGAGR